MAKTWVLDTETKGTGANMVPLDQAEKPADPRPLRRSGAAPGSGAPAARPKAKPKAAEAGRKVSTPLPPGHVRKIATGELGRVKAVDAKAGTATVQWLKRGATSTVPLSSISRR